MTDDASASPAIPPTAAAQGVAACHTCGRVSGAEEFIHCPRCGTPLHVRKPHSLERTWAFLIAAAILYIPANVMPIMTMSGLEGGGSNTILGGVVTFWKMRAYPVAIVIFTASVLIPILKVAALIWLCLAAAGRTTASPRALARIYHLTEKFGRWSMVDVFVVSILVCLVQFGSLLTVAPGPAAPAFSGVVILTMFAAMSFDPRLIWDAHRSRQAPPPPTPSSSTPSSPSPPLAP